MGCPRCGTPLEGRFCVECGLDTQPAFLCPVCGTAFSGWWCPTCGAPVGAPAPPPGSTFRSIMSVAWTIGFLLFLALVVVNLLALAYASVVVVEGASAGGPRYIDLYVLAPFPVGERFDAAVSTFLLYFAVVVAVIVAAHLWHGFRDGKSTARAVARPLDELRARLESKSAWVATGQVFLAALFFQFAFILIVAAAGGNPSAPPSSGTTPPWYPFYALANAAVYEEFVSRWLLIGVPLAISAGILQDLAPAGQPRVSAWRHLVGGTVRRDSPRAIVLIAAVLAIVSSIVFGLAHVPSWGWWKFTPAAVAGLGIAYLFLRHGVLAGVLFHFSTNYMGAVALFTESNFGAQVLLGLFILFLLGFGAVFFAWYLRYGAEIVRHVAASWGLAKPAPAAVAPPAPAFSPPPTREFAPVPPPAAGPPPLAAPPYGTGFLAFRCARCGWPEARYAEGRLTCLRCGHGS